ncbi:MAG: class I SAM-dependent methyltransferase [Planctomycetes bacterium]|nr:class I SAM-dependent methyltransferase [Planctomycetota bacterium]
MAKHLFNDDDLERSEIVSNAAMNRGRGIAGVNSYSRELRFDILDVLQQLLNHGHSVAWLDVCCGTGTALVEAALELQRRFPQANVAIHGVDLINMFCDLPTQVSEVRFQACPLHAFQPQRTYDLITCVHGLHYLGDKLTEIARLVSWLKPSGRFVGNFDAACIRSETGCSLASSVGKLFRQAGLSYNGRTKLLSCTGSAVVKIPWSYLGADPAAGANYTGQPAADSYYRVN